MNFLIVVFGCCIVLLQLYVTAAQSIDCYTCPPQIDPFCYFQCIYIQSPPLFNPPLLNPYTLMPSYNFPNMPFSNTPDIAYPYSNNANTANYGNDYYGASSVQPINHPNSALLPIDKRNYDPTDDSNVATTAPSSLVGRRGFTNFPTNLQELQQAQTHNAEIKTYNNSNQSIAISANRISLQALPALGNRAL